MGLGFTSGVVQKHTLWVGLKKSLVWMNKIRYIGLQPDKRIQKLTVDQIKKIKNYSFTTLLKMASMNEQNLIIIMWKLESSDRLETTKNESYSKDVYGRSTNRYEKNGKIY